MEKAHILHKVSLPKSWTDQHHDLKMSKQASKESSKGKSTTPRTKLEESQHLVLAYFKADFAAKDVLSRFEEVQLRALRRAVGLKVMADVVNTKMKPDAVVSSLNWLCSALRKGSNFLAHYTDD